MTGYVLLYDIAKSRSKSSSTRKTLAGAARVRVDKIEDGICTVTYLGISGPEHLVGRQDTFSRSAVYITADEREKFLGLVNRFWGTQWRGQGGH